MRELIYWVLFIAFCITSVVLGIKCGNERSANLAQTDYVCTRGNHYCERYSPVEVNVCAEYKAEATTEVKH